MITLVNTATKRPGVLPFWHKGPRVGCRHCSSFRAQFLHVHPRMFIGEDATTRIVHTSDHSGHGNGFVADVPALDRLPAVE
ncbi:MAG: hypothetical protein ACOC93_02280 [Planctomycetota bacterium]